MESLYRSLLRSEVVLPVPSKNKPMKKDQKSPCEEKPCLHGRCIVDIKNEFFCDCFDGWTGFYCHVPDTSYG